MFIDLLLCLVINIHVIVALDRESFTASALMLRAYATRYRPPRQRLSPCRLHGSRRPTDGRLGRTSGPCLLKFSPHQCNHDAPLVPISAGHRNGVPA